MEDKVLNEQSTGGASPVAEATTEREGSESRIDSFGKFKSADELLKAYNCLESEFTKRSQRLRQLESEKTDVESDKAAKPEFVVPEKRQENELEQESVVTETNSTSTAEQEQAVPEKRTVSAEELKAFRTKYPNADLSELTKIMINDGDMGVGGVERAYIKYLIEANEKTRSEGENEELLLEKVRNKDGIKNEIIKEYLRAIDVSRPTAKIMSGGGGAAATPPKRPKTIDEAGLLVKELLSAKK